MRSPRGGSDSGLAFPECAALGAPPGPPRSFTPLSRSPLGTISIPEEQLVMPKVHSWEVAELRFEPRQIGLHSRCCWALPHAAGTRSAAW